MYVKTFENQLLFYDFATVPSQTLRHKLKGNRKSAETHGRDGVNHAVRDLVLPHVFHHVKLGRSLLGYDLVSDLLQLGVKLLKEILKQQRQKLEERPNQHIHDFTEV